jgi:hypothetical protein
MALRARTLRGVSGPTTEQGRSSDAVAENREWAEAIVACSRGKMFAYVLEEVGDVDVALRACTVIWQRFRVMAPVWGGLGPRPLLMLIGTTVLRNLNQTSPNLAREASRKPTAPAL